MADSVGWEVDALIVGAGPVGLSLACALRLQGVDCLLVDDGDGPTPLHESRALGIQARTLEAFQRLSVVDAMLAEGRRLNGFSVYNNQRRMAGLRLALDPDDTRYPFVLCLPQSRTERILIDRLAELGGSVSWGTRLASFTTSDEGAAAELRDAAGRTRRVHARWLIGCDGPHSSVRHGLGLSFEGTAYEQRFLLADVRVDWRQPDDEISAILTSEGLFAAIPLPEPGRWRLVDASGAAVGSDPGAITARFQDLVRRFAAPEATVGEASWTSSFAVHRRVVDRFRQGRCILAGDAAHVHSPAGGQGLNTGVQDACNLSWKLALAVRGEAAGGLLDSYHAERRPVALAVLHGSDLATRLITLHNPLLRNVRNRVFQLVSTMGLARREISTELSELAVHYPESPIVGKNRPGWFGALRLGGATAFRAARAFRRGPWAGDRMPDPPIAPADPIGGKQRRLSDVVFGDGPARGRHVLLVFQGTEAESGALEVEFRSEEFVSPWRSTQIRPILIEPKAPVEPSPAWKGERLADPTNALHHRFGAVGACLYLIRPDGYIGYRSQPLDSLAFREYLKRVFR